MPAIKNTDLARTSWLQARGPAAKKCGFRTQLAVAGTRACCQKHSLRAWLVVPGTRGHAICLWKIRLTHAPRGCPHACLLSKNRLCARASWFQARAATPLVYRKYGWRTHLVVAGTRACCQKIWFAHVPRGCWHACLLSKNTACGARACHLFKENTIDARTSWLQARVPAVKNADPSRTSWLQARVPAGKK